MALPQSNQYYFAVQTPKIAFADAELQRCSIELTNQGLPKPYSGGFTTTYHLSDASRSWAVRCFTREIRDLQKRYEAIGRFLSGNLSEPFVAAALQHNGIKVNNQPYPIIKMEWISGESISSYIEKNLGFQSRIEKLAVDFRGLVQLLEKFGVAHGDLQHGNIIIKHDRLYLIDYDGMYLPELAGMPSDELGHINYQHPARGTQDYGPTTDRFSSIVIHLALTALSRVPSLWHRYDTSENILFCRDDFVDAENSPLLAELATITPLNQLIERFKGVCRMSCGDAPSLEQFLSGQFIFPSISVVAPATSVARTQYPVLDASRKSKWDEFVGTRVEVVGRIDDYHRGIGRNGQPYAFLNFGFYPRQTFTLVMWKATINAFEEMGIELNSFHGKWISAIGVVDEYNQKPQMIIDAPNQIKILKGEDEAKAKINPKSGSKQLGPKHTPIPSRLPATPIPSASHSSTTFGTSSSRPIPPASQQPTQSAPFALKPTRGSSTASTTSPAAAQHPSPPSTSATPPKIAKQDADVLNALYGKQGVARSQSSLPPSQTFGSTISTGASSNQSSPPSQPNAGLAPMPTAKQSQHTVASSKANPAMPVLAILLTAFGCMILSTIGFAGLLSGGTHHTPTVIVVEIPAIATIASTETQPITPLPTATHTITPTPSATPTPLQIVVKMPASLRAGPGLNYDVIRTIPEGIMVHPIEVLEGGNWIHVLLLDEHLEGWMHETTLSQVPELSALPLAIVVPPSPTVIPPTITPSATLTTTLPPPTLPGGAVVIACNPDGGFVNIENVRAWYIERYTTITKETIPQDGRKGGQMARNEQAIYIATDGSGPYVFCRGVDWRVP